MDAAYTGKQIAQRRKDLGLTQKELAEKLHVTDKAVSKWERGINFPDLGLMESLAQALGTSPACLLGLENADQDEVLSSITQISNEQLWDAQRDIKWIGWGSIGVAVLLILVYRFIAYQRTHAYQLLYCLIPVIALGGIHLLFKYGEIRKWNTMDWVAAYCAAIPVIIVNGAYLFLDYGLHDTIELVLALISVGAVQLLFYRIMRPRLMKACPVFFAAAFALWHALDGDLPIEYVLLAGCCAMVWLICRRKDSTKKGIPTKRAVIAAIACLILSSVLCYSSLTQAYVNLFHGHLETYAEALLADSTEISSHSYGFWKVFVHPDEGMVEFYTGGSGLVPSSIYEGFYYSIDNTHIPFQGAEVPIEEHTNSARWADGTDNWGISTRIRENWFWFEAHF